MSYDAKYVKKWRIERARGLTRLTPATRAQNHVQALSAAGASIRGIAEAAGVGPSYISKLNRGTQGSLSHAKEGQILAVKPEHIFSRPNPKGFVPNIGARRRIQALLAIGWRHQDISAAIGCKSNVLLHQAGDWISRRKHESVVAAYERMWNQPGPSLKTARLAAKHGHRPPMAWDDDTIDNPAHTPDAGVDKVNRGAERINDIVFLIETGAGQTEIVERSGFTNYKTLERFCLRHGRGDVARRAKLIDPAQRTKEATKNRRTSDAA